MLTIMIALCAASATVVAAVAVIRFMADPARARWIRLAQRARTREAAARVAARFAALPSMTVVPLAPPAPLVAPPDERVA